jgi:hypothetical protein
VSEDHANDEAVDLDGKKQVVEAEVEEVEEAQDSEAEEAEDSEVDDAEDSEVEVEVKACGEVPVECLGGVVIHLNPQKGERRVSSQVPTSQKNRTEARESQT